MEISDFIQKVLIDGFKEIQREERYPTISFYLICQGIEFLGACLDANGFSAKGLGAPRFRRAIYDLFPESYHPYNRGVGNHQTFMRFFKMAYGILFYQGPG